MSSPRSLFCRILCVVMISCARGQQYLTVPQQHQCNNGPSRIHGGQVPTTPGNLIHLRTGSCPGPTSIVSPGAHQLFAAGSAGPTPPPPPHHGHMGGGGGPPGHHHHAPRMPPSQHMHLSAPPDQQHMVGGGSGVKPHPLASSPGRGPSPYGSSPGNTFYVDVSPAYHVDCDDDRTPHTPMWPASSSLSPPSVRSGGNGNAGMRSSPPLRGMPGGVLGCHGCHGGPGGPGGLGYKDRARQSSLDEGRMSSTAGGGGGCGVRNMRCNSDGGQMTVSQNPGCGGNNGDEFSLDLKKVRKGVTSFVHRREHVSPDFLLNKSSPDVLLFSSRWYSFLYLSFFPRPLFPFLTCMNMGYCKLAQPTMAFGLNFFSEGRCSRSNVLYYD